MDGIQKTCNILDSGQISKEERWASQDVRVVALDSEHMRDNLISLEWLTLNILVDWVLVKVSCMSTYASYVLQLKQRL